MDMVYFATAHGAADQAEAVEPIDAERGSWLRPLLDTGAQDLNVVPRGFPAYARVFHPAIRDRPTGEDGGPVTWTEVARVFGKTMHPLAQYHRLIGPEVGERQEVLDSSGWRYSEPDQGNLAVHLLGPVTTVLCRHTTTPDHGVAAVWEGWGGFTGSAGYRPLTAVRGRLPGILGKLTAAHRSGAGLLPAKSIRNSRLSLPGRDYVLFAAAPRAFTDDAWIHGAPWNRGQYWPQSPTLLWPEDRAWVMVTEIDFDSTIVAGSPGLVAELIAADPSIEAFQISEGARPDPGRRRRKPAAVVAVSHPHDLLGVLPHGAPETEYDPEMEDFAALVTAGTPITPAVVATAWRKWFGDGQGETSGEPEPPTSSMVALAVDLQVIQRGFLQY